MKKQIITLNGLQGSGKSSTAKRVASILGYDHFSSGDLFREIAKDHGVSVEEINTIAEGKVDIDHEVDEKLKNLNNKDQFVIDSRMAFHWIPESFKVFLDLDLQVGAERIFSQIKDQGRESQTAESVEEVLESSKHRLESETKRYKSLYGINPFDSSQYDLVVDTEKNNLDQVVEIVVAEYKKWLEN